MKYLGFVKLSVNYFFFMHMWALQKKTVNDLYQGQLLEAIIVY